MMRIAKTFKFSMGHTLSNYDGDCHNLHGHNYRLDVVIEGRVDTETRMVLDYAELKTIMLPIIDKYDHKFAICENDPRLPLLKQASPESLHIMEYEPTAESIGTQILGSLAYALDGFGFLDALIPQVKIWETDDSYAETF